MSSILEIVGAVPSNSALFGVGPGVQTTTEAGATWPAANRALYLPFRISERVTVKQFAIRNGAAVSGNVDAGIYDVAGTRIVSLGSTAQAGANGVQLLNITDTQIGPGMYYAALAMDNTTGTMFALALALPILKMVGVVEEASAFPLPAVATFATLSSAYYPYAGLSLGGVF